MPSPTKKQPRLRVRVTAAAEREIRKGHPWVFASSVREENRDGEAGELAVIYDRVDRFLAIGLFDPASPLRVRILHQGDPIQIDQQFWKRKLELVLRKREETFDHQTTGYRCIHGESDGWPGLVLDKYSDTCVLKLYTCAWFRWLPDIRELFETHLRPERLVLRLSRNIRQPAERAGYSDGQLLIGAPITGPILFQETGLTFEADVLRGQKTGFFLDQRENRRQVEQLSAGLTVLNTFSFSGGFSIYAARGGATAVADLDISRHALASGERNFALNAKIPAVLRCPRSFIQADAFQWLASSSGLKFGMVVLDPPALAKRQSERTEAMSAYRRLIEGGLGKLQKRGILVAASCSAQVTESEFFQIATEVLQKSKRKFKELLRTSQPPDHPAAFEEARYLKCGFYQLL